MTEQVTCLDRECVTFIPIHHTEASTELSIFAQGWPGSNQGPLKTDVNKLITKVMTLTVYLIW